MKIILDKFPCHLSAVAVDRLEDISQLNSYQPTHGANYMSKTRVILTETEIVVAKDDHDGPVVVFQEKYAQVFLSQKTDEDTRVITISGKMLAFKKDTACGCGSRLRGWNPYRTLSSIKD
jgi:hypothetical protein